jgi:hypothetical protein
MWRRPVGCGEHILPWRWRGLAVEHVRRYAQGDACWRFAAVQTQSTRQGPTAQRRADPAPAETNNSAQQKCLIKSIIVRVVHSPENAFPHHPLLRGWCEHAFSEL